MRMLSHGLFVVAVRGRKQLCFDGWFHGRFFDFNTCRVWRGKLQPQSEL